MIGGWKRTRWTGRTCWTNWRDAASRAALVGCVRRGGDGSRGEDRRGIPEGVREPARRTGGLRYLLSRTVSTWFGLTFSSTCTAPDGQRISIFGICASLPRPKCTPAWLEEA